MSAQKEIVKRAVVIVAEDRFRDEDLMILLRVLDGAGIGTAVASRAAGLCRGMLGGTATAWMAIEEIDVSAYDAMVLIGGAGCLTTCDVPAVHGRIREAVEAGRIVGAIGEAVAVVARAGVVTRKKVAVRTDDRAVVRAAGGIVASGSVAVDGCVVTAEGHGAVTDFAQALRRRLLQSSPKSS